MADSTTTNIHVNDSGVLFLITVSDANGVVNLTGAENIEIFFQKPDKTVFSKPCETVNAVGGVIRYVSLAGDFDQAGRWKNQIVIRFGDDTVRHSDVGTLTIDKNLPV